MRKHIQLFVLIALLIGYAAPLLAQASTEGKEFWVSSSLVCSPDKATPTPYIAVSAEKACTVTITGGVGNAINITQQVAAGSWNEFGNSTKAYNTNPTQGLINVQMDASKWYPTNMTNANNVSSLAAQKNMYGLHITATEKVSVYVVLSSTHSMDASNILPMTALGSEYYTQDYWSKVKSDFNDAVGLTTILGTENGTVIDITPNGDTFDGWTSGSTHQITLDQGQTYYLVTKKGERLSGTHIKARNGKKIAIYCGVPITNVPTDIAARDCLFEQPMPVEYWGTQFIATRSLEKNANIIGITAMTNNTEIMIDGYTQGFINEGQTYYILLQGPNKPSIKDTISSHRDLIVEQDAIYIETSCPCAVYSYDTGNSCKGSDTGSEIVNGQGDPSSVWVSPIQQKISKITFGTCYTAKTEDHFLNVITETATCQNTTLTAFYGTQQIDKTGLLTWTAVPGNPTYSYARAKIGDSSTKNYSVFRLDNSKGFIATVYGNGEDESYAYSAGSAAVEQGVNVNGEVFSNGYRSDSKFCVENIFTFDANVGTDQISRVDWNFGDGTSEYYGASQTTHQYTSPGWYDVTAELYGHQVCTNESEQYLGKVSFSFLVVRADTIPVSPKDSCLSLAQQEYIISTKGQAYLDSLVTYGEQTILNPDDPCYEDRLLSLVVYNLDTEETLDTITGEDRAQGYNGKWYERSTDVTDTLFNTFGCYHFRHYYVKVVTCLDLSIPNNTSTQHTCPGEAVNVTYTIKKGNIADIDEFGNNAIFKVPGQPDVLFTIPDRIVEDASLSLPTENIKKPGHYTGQVIVNDAYCNQKPTFNIDFTVYYPDNIFKYKYNNVLAIYNPGYGGNTGYEFTHYEWHLIREESDSIIGTDASVLYLGNNITFEVGDFVYVVLTDQNNNVLPSCVQYIDVVDDYNDTPAHAPATKHLVNRQIIIRKEGREYNIYGQLIQ